MRGAVLIPHLIIAQQFFTRFWGLMLRREIADNEGILFPHCNSIHTFFMRIPIDVVFISKKGIVVAVVENLSPWRVLFPRPGADAVLEIGAARARTLGLAEGEQLEAEGIFNAH